MSYGNDFQAACLARISEVLQEHGLGDTEFKFEADGNPRFTATFICRSREYKIEVHEDIPVMYCGDQLFEPYLSQEFESEESLREGFATRLDRYLGGGSWAGPNEPGFWESVKIAFRDLFRRKNATK